MQLPSILIASGENVGDELASVLSARYSRDAADLIVFLGRDAQALKSCLPETLREVPILALTGQHLSDDVLRAVEAEFINAPPAAMHPQIVSRPAGPSNPRAVDTPGGSARTSGLIDGHRLIGDSPAMQEIRSSIARVAATDSNVLITGETGTGKELIAELIQQNGKRSKRRYICINCAAIPDSLLESELFGYERGAFTGAQVAGEGKLEGVDGGTVFFDEIGEMSLHAQAKILRLIETRELQRLGAKRSTRVDFRIIAATNQDVDSPASAARFRRDLYFRLNVARIHVPPLRERKVDIPLLLAHSIERFNRQFGRRVEEVEADSMRLLLRYDWPGNVRELKNTVEALFVDAPSGGETRLRLGERMRRHMSVCADADLSEQERLLEALWATDWNKSKTARQLHWSRMTLYRKMVKYQLDGERARKPPQAAAAGQSRSANGARA